MLRKRLHILLITSLFTTMLSAQDPHFTQFYANPLYLNPAFAGTAVCPRFTLNYRNQWQSLPGNYNTYSLGYDVQKANINGGLGLIAFADRQGGGIYSNYSIGGMYSYNIASGPGLNFKAAIEVRAFQKTLDWDKLYFGDQIDAKYGFIYNTAEQKPGESKIVPDFSFGILGYNKIFYFGGAVHHLTQPDEGFIAKSHLPRKYTGHAGAIINLRTGFSGRGKTKLEDPMLSPNFVYQNQRNLQQFNYGLYFNKFPIIFGAWYRNSTINSDALSFLVGIQAETVKIGYSYDITVSKLDYTTGGAHEVSCGIKLPCRPVVKKIRPINCPTF